jgi:hypothetical protein
VYSKIAYRWRHEREAALNDLNGRLADRTASEKRTLVERLNKEADTIDARIKEVAAMEEKGFWLCENDHEEPISTAFAGIELEISRDCSTCHKPMKLVRRDLMSGQEKYESDKERGEAEKIVASKREQAKGETENAEGSDQTAKFFRDQAAKARSTAEKIRSL